MKDDSKNALYIENLTKEYVTSYDDVTQILIKGLSNRKVGATSLNSKSSRSHIIFTFVIVSWCKIVFFDRRNSSETLPTPRFGQRVRTITNELVINEIKEKDEELIRAKPKVHSSDGSKNGYLQVRNVRDNLDNDINEEENMDKEDIRQLCQQIDELCHRCDQW
ncbi:Kinesin-like protein KIN-12F [Glycine soja]